MKMTAVRLLRWIVLLAGLGACTTWSYISIDRLLNSSLNSQQRVSAYNATSEPVAAHIQDMEAAQQRWGKQSMFAVACAFLMVMAVLINWVLDGRTPRRPRE